MKSINALKQLIQTRFSIKDLGDMKFVVDIEVARSRKEIYIFQHKYALEIIKETGLFGVKHVDFSMEKSKLSNKRELLKAHVVYQCLVGRLIYHNQQT